MIFTLKQYDFELLTFELRQEGLDGFACSILSVNEAKRHLLPHGMPLNVDGLLAWLKSRIIPRNREHVDNLEMHYFHLKRYRKKLDKKNRSRSKKCRSWSKKSISRSTSHDMEYFYPR